MKDLLSLKILFYPFSFLLARNSKTKIFLFTFILLPLILISSCMEEEKDDSEIKENFTSINTINTLFATGTYWTITQTKDFQTNTVVDYPLVHTDGKLLNRYGGFIIDGTDNILRRYYKYISDNIAIYLPSQDEGYSFDLSNILLSTGGVQTSYFVVYKGDNNHYKLILHDLSDNASGYIIIKQDPVSDATLITMFENAQAGI